MGTSSAPVLLILRSHLQGFVTEITALRIHKTTQNKHHVFLKDKRKGYVNLFHFRQWTVV